ncbi:MAG TPA: CaiB/BaiF CoA-transferase family protein [Myxococcales bacterium]|jgi:formyl-CoA transferase
MGPLSGIKVVELGGLIAAPYATSILAQFGAEVVKIEAPGKGDPLRRWRKVHKGTSYWWYSLNRNKKSVALDLKSERGRRIAFELLKRADIVVENFRPGYLESLGLGPETLLRENPKLILVRISGYGQTGPYKDKPGFAAVAEAVGGLRYVSGYPDRPPVRVGISLGDSLASLHGVIGALLALHHLKSGGKGQVVDVALYESVFNLMESLIPEYSALGHIRERTGSALPGIAPSNSYPCQDGDVVIAGNSDGIFVRLMEAIGRKDLAQDARLAHNEGRAAHIEEIDSAIGAWTERRASADVLRALDKAEVPCAKAFSAKDIHEDPHYRARGMIEPHRLNDGTQLDLPGIAPKLSETPGETRWLGPALGEHTSEVLASLGLDEAEVEALRKEGVVS